MSNIVKRNEDQIQRSEGASPSPFALATFDDAWRFARMAATSGMTSCKTPEQAMMVLAIGAELGLTPAQSLQRIAPIRGKACPSADTLVAVCLSSGLAEYFDEISSDDTSSTWETKRKGRPPKRYTFTIADAKRAGLVRADSPWATFPRRMVAARAKTFLARDVYPDLLAGMYSQEEAPEIDVGYQVPKEPIHDKGTILAEDAQFTEEPSYTIPSEVPEGTFEEEPKEHVPSVDAPKEHVPSVDAPNDPSRWILAASTLAECDARCKSAIADGMLRDDAIKCRKAWVANSKGVAR